jgi:restriction endonuclease S subunit
MVCKENIDINFLQLYKRRMQRKTLQEISEIIAGYTFRGALKNDSNGEIRVLLAKNINTDGTINFPELIRINLTLPRTNAFVTKADVLLSSRGVFRAGVFDKDSKNIIAASSLYILRIKNSSVDPEFLSIYFNSEVGQNSIQKILTGSTIKTVLRGALETLSMPIPTLANQKKIIDINDNWKKRQKLLSRKIDLSKNIAEAAIKQLLTT